MARIVISIAAAAALLTAPSAWAQDTSDQQTLDAMSQTVDGMELDAQQIEQDINAIDERLTVLEAGLTEPQPLPEPMPPLLLSVDDFERSDLGSDWVIAAGPVGIVNDSDIGLLTKGRAGFPVWTGSVLGPDQFSEVELSVDMSPQMIVQAFARRRASDLARYGLQYNITRKSPRWEIWYTGVPGDQQRLLASDKAAAGPQPGDSLRIEVSGADPVVIKGYHNGVLVLEISDSAAERILDGRPGLVYRFAKKGRASYPAAVAEAWQAGML